MNQRYERLGRAGLVLTACLLGASLSRAESTYSGRAFGVELALVNPQPNVLEFSDTGELPPQGGTLSATLVNVQVGVGTLSSQTVTASTNGANEETNSFASQEGVAAFIGQPAQLTASVVRADAHADCGGVQGSSVVLNLVFGGNSITVTGQPNQTIDLSPIATLVINEQIVDSGGTGITVNALHLSLGTGEDLILSSARACMQCPLALETTAWGAIKALYRP